jgi:hypothetical protein
MSDKYMVIERSRNNHIFITHVLIPPTSQSSPAHPLNALQTQAHTYTAYS